MFDSYHLGRGLLVATSWVSSGCTGISLCGVPLNPTLKKFWRPWADPQQLMQLPHRQRVGPTVSYTCQRPYQWSVALVVQRLIDPCSKLAITQHWHTTTPAEELGVGEATEDDLYEAMDWLFEQKERIEKKLAAGHLTEGGLVLYDVSRSSMRAHLPVGSHHALSRGTIPSQGDASFRYCDLSSDAPGQFGQLYLRAVKG